MFMYLARRKEMKRSKRTYDICSMFYFTVLKNIINFIEQSNKMSTNNDVVSKSFRIQIQISQFSFQQQQQKTIEEKKRTFISETDEKAVKKEVKIAKTLRKYFVNRSIANFRNKEVTKKFITKINRNSKNVENEEKL